jgi:hypothetical protein
MGKSLISRIIGGSYQDDPWIMHVTKAGLSAMILQTNSHTGAAKGGLRDEPYLLLVKADNSRNRSCVCCDTPESLQSLPNAIKNI